MRWDKMEGGKKAVEGRDVKRSGSECEKVKCGGWGCLGLWRGKRGIEWSE
jgi:hypothetical protein